MASKERERETKRLPRGAWTEMHTAHYYALLGAISNVNDCYQKWYQDRRVGSDFLVGLSGSSSSFRLLDFLGGGSIGGGIFERDAAGTSPTALKKGEEEHCRRYGSSLRGVGEVCVRVYPTRFISSRRLPLPNTIPIGSTTLPESTSAHIKG